MVGINPILDSCPLLDGRSGSKSKPNINPIRQYCYINFFYLFWEIFFYRPVRVDVSTPLNTSCKCDMNVDVTNLETNNLLKLKMCSTPAKKKSVRGQPCDVNICIRES